MSSCLDKAAWGRLDSEVVHMGRKIVQLLSKLAPKYHNQKRVYDDKSVESEGRECTDESFVTRYRADARVCISLRHQLTLLTN